MDLSGEGIRKAAILVTALDRDTADRLLEQMRPEEAQRVRDAVLELGEVDPAEQRRVIDEFFRRRPAPAVQRPKAARAPKASVQRPPASDEPRPRATRFQRLREAEADRLAEILAPERPQMIALVLSQLAPEQAGRVLGRLAPDVQVEVIRRLVDLEETDPEVLEEIERAFEARLARQVPPARPRAAGLAAVAGIIRAAGQHCGVQILDNLAAHDPQLAQQIGSEPVRFEQLAFFDNATLAAVFEAADPEVARLALIGAPEYLVQRILDQLPPAEAAQLRHRLRHIGPTRLSDVQEARRQMEQIAWRVASVRGVRLLRPTPLAA